MSAGVAQRRLAEDESGIVAVEFALVLPFILVFLFAIIDFGQIFNHVNDANQIAADGARFAAVNVSPNGATLQSYLAQQADTQYLEDHISVCVDFPNGSSNVGDPVRVNVTSSFQLVPLLGGSTIDLHGSATMRLERPPTPAIISAGC